MSLPHGNQPRERRTENVPRVFLDHRSLVVLHDTDSANQLLLHNVLSNLADYLQAIGGDRARYADVGSEFLRDHHHSFGLVFDTADPALPTETTEQGFCVHSPSRPPD